MDVKSQNIQRGIFLSLEILFNIIILIIIPKKHHFESEYLYNICIKYQYPHYVDCHLNYLIEDIDSPRETAIAVLVFGCFLCFLYLIKIIIFFRKDEEDCVKIVETINMGGLFINLCMLISIIAKFNKLIKDEKIYGKLLSGLKSKIIACIVLYFFCYLFILFQYWIFFDNDDCNNCFNKNEKNSHQRNINYVGNYITTTNTNRNLNTTSRNIRTVNVQVHHRVRRTTTHVLLLKNVLPAKIYENIRLFIELGKQKLIALILFYKEMKFDGFTSDENIRNEITSIIVLVSALLSEVFGDPVAKACLQTKSGDHLMLLMHYAFPLIIEVIKLKIEKGIYKRSYNLVRTNLIQVLTQVEQRITRDEQGNLRLTFRVNRQVNQATLVGLLHN